MPACLAWFISNNSTLGKKASRTAYKVQYNSYHQYNKLMHLGHDTSNSGRRKVLWHMSVSVHIILAIPQPFVRLLYKICKEQFYCISFKEKSLHRNASVHFPLICFSLVNILKGKLCC